MHESCHACSHLCVQNEWFHTHKEVTLHVWTSHVMQIVICALRSSDVVLFVHWQRANCVICATSKLYEWRHSFSMHKWIVSFVHWQRVTSCVICALRTSDVTHTEKLHYTYGWVMSGIQLFARSEGVLSFIWRRHVTLVYKSWHTYKGVMTHTWRSHVTSRIWMSHVTHIHWSCHTCKQVMSYKHASRICHEGWLRLVGSLKQ